VSPDTSGSAAFGHFVLADIGGCHCLHRAHHGLQVGSACDLALHAGDRVGHGDLSASSPAG